MIIPTDSAVKPRRSSTVMGPELAGGVPANPGGRI